MEACDAVEDEVVETGVDRTGVKGFLWARAATLLAGSAAGLPRPRARCTLCLGTECGSS